MHLNTLKPAKGSRKVRVRVGRGIGSGLGKTAGRGHKGQFARTVKFKVKAGFEGGQMPMQRRLPKVGFRSKIGHEVSEVLLYQLDSIKGDVVDFATLQAAGLIATRAIRAKIVKKGEIKRAVKLKEIGRASCRERV